MKTRKFAFGLLVLSLVGFGVGYILSESYEFGICIQNDIFCHSFFERVGDAVYYGMGALAIVFLILLVLPQAFGTWKNFAIWFVPLAALLFATYQNPASGDLFSPYPEQVFQWVSGFYILISLLIIGWKSFRLDHK